jgi:hypothetical protein
MPFTTDIRDRLRLDKKEGMTRTHDKVMVKCGCGATVERGRMARHQDSIAHWRKEIQEVVDTTFLTLKEIAEMYGVTRQRITQLVGEKTEGRRATRAFYRQQEVLLERFKKHCASTESLRSLVRICKARRYSLAPVPFPQDKSRLKIGVVQITGCLCSVHNAGAHGVRGLEGSSGATKFALFFLGRDWLVVPKRRIRPKIVHGSITRAQNLSPLDYGKYLNAWHRLEE